VKNLKSVLLWAAVIGCTGTACQQRIKTTSFIVGPTRSVSPGISEGGKLQWVTSDGPDFVVHFYSESPCVDGKNDIKGTKDAPAVCTIKSGFDGLYKVAILAPGESIVVGKPPVMYPQVDWCPTPKCTKALAAPPVEKPTVGVPGSQIPNPPLVPIACDSDTASADPPTLEVYAGQQVMWQQVGPDATTSWETDVPPGVCQEGTTFGTIVSKSPLSCTVTSGAKVGETYSYSLKYTSKTLNKACGGKANLTITGAPAAAPQ
jgi:hypothetical protein